MSATYRHPADSRRAAVRAVLVAAIALAFSGHLFSQPRRLPPVRTERPVFGAQRVVTMPNLSARNLADADALLTNLNLKLGKIQDVAKDLSSLDVILGQVPAPGTTVLAGSSVDVQVGIATVRVPRLKGKSLGEAVKSLQEAHLDLGQVTAVNPSGTQAPGMVLGSNPAEGSALPSHRKVVLLVVAGTVEVPDLTGRSLAGVQTTLWARNLALGSITGRPFRIAGTGAQPAAAYEIISDWSSKGRSVPIGTAIDISFPGGSIFVTDRIMGSLATSEMLKAIRGVPRTYPTKEDHVTSMELLSILLQPKTGMRMEVMAALHLDPIFPAGIKVIQDFEGWEPNLYNDAAHYCTIGFGHLVAKAPCDGSEPEEFQRGLTPPRGVELLQSDLYTAHSAVARLVKIRLTEGQVAALTDFVFNVGSANFRASTLLTVVNANDFDKAPAQFRRWVLAGGKKWPGLVKRREGEISLFFAGMNRARALRLPPHPEPEPPPVDIQIGEGH